MLFPVIVSLVVFGILLFLISFKVKQYDAEAHIEDLSFRNAAEMYKIKKRLKVLEEELLLEIKE